MRKPDWTQPFSMSLSVSDPESIRAATRQAMAGIKAGDQWGRIFSAGDVLGTWHLDAAHAEARAVK